jgi:hypothetical protein
MSILSGMLRVGVFGAVLLIAGRASAVSETYVFLNGFAEIQVTNDLGQTIGGPLNVTLNGIQVTVDEASGALVSMDLSTVGPWVLAVDPTLSGGFDTITIHQATLSTSGGVLTLLDPGPPRFYDFVTGPVAVISNFTASMSTVPGSDVPFAGVPANAPSASGDLFLEGSGVGATLSLNGITIARLEAPPQLSGGGVNVKADFVFVGTNPIPEAHAVVLFVVGGVIAAWASRKRLARA